MVVYGVEVGEPVIFSPEDQCFIAEKIAEASKRYDLELLAFNVLPDHVHLVIAAETEKDLNEYIRKIKGYSSFEFQRSRGWEKGQHVWAQKFHRQPITDDAALTEILNYVWNNHLKHIERWGNELISTWEAGDPDKGLKPLVAIIRSGCFIDEGTKPTGETDSPTRELTRGLSPLLQTGGKITKFDIFHYVYAVLHHPAYRTKYELNLKREFPRIPFYANFQQWADWGKQLMDLHINFEEAEPYALERMGEGMADESHLAMQASLFGDETTNGHSHPTKKAAPKCKLKADKITGTIELDTVTTLKGIPAIAWDYKLGNRSALEWILDQYKEKKPKDPTIAKLFNTYRFADYKEHVIDLLQRVCTVSVKTMAIIQQMPNA